LPENASPKVFGMVGPNKTLVLSFERPTPFTVNEIDALKARRVALYYIGTVTYEDEFRKPRGLKFSLLVEPPKAEGSDHHLPPVPPSSR
jgi:hypothetical protein